MTDRKDPPRTIRTIAMDGYRAAPRPVTNKVVPPTGGSSVKPPPRKK